MNAAFAEQASSINPVYFDMDFSDAVVVMIFHSMLSIRESAGGRGAGVEG